MLDLLKKTFFSSKLTAFLLLVFLTAIGIGTFIENDYGTVAAKKVIYNAHWFELVIFILGINLVGNILKYRLWRRDKLAIFMFHISWIVIVLGAGVTRYTGYEGSMHIREGESSNEMVSARTFLNLNFNNGVKQWVLDKPVLINPLYNSHFDYDINFDGKDINVSYVDFIPNAVDSVVSVDNGKEILELVTVGSNGRKSVFLSSGETKLFGAFPLSFNDDSSDNMSIKLTSSPQGVIVTSPYDIEYLSMDDKQTGILKKDTTHLFTSRRLYTISNVQIVLKNHFENAAVTKVSMPKEDMSGEDILIVNVSSGDESKQAFLPGGAGYISPRTVFEINGLNFSGNYGAKMVEVPFSIQLNDFQLETYPGSKSPSSYASEVTLIDPSQSLSEDHRIYMNHVLDHRGYRFFQSSYDQDQLGTVLSVNHDYWGTVITYIGYLLMTIGMLFTFISKHARYNSLRKKLTKLRNKKLNTIAAIAFGLFSLSAIAQSDSLPRTIIPMEHINKFDRLIVQDSEGRFMPLQSYNSKLARKITIAKKYKGMTASQLMLSMVYDRGYWQNNKMIKLEHPLLAEELNAEKVKVGMSNYYFVSFRQMFDDHGAYILEDKIATANRKPAAERSKYDKDVIKLDERVSVSFMIYDSAEIYRLFPNPNDPEGSWYSSADGESFEDTTRLFVSNIIPLYMMGIQESIANNDWTKADDALGYISSFQSKYGHHVMPSEERIDMELKYNDYNFFNRSMGIYLLIGILFLIVSFFELFYNSRFIKFIQWLFIAILFLTFIFHGIGLGMRWWISGHAPWSNAYEALTFIAWGTVLSGFIFVRSSRITMAATALLAGMTLFVAWLSWLNPEITNLQPVLKSYWLTIHVAVITSSYAFLGLAAILGLTNLILMIFRGDGNKERLGDAINELTYISEMTMTIGVFAAAIGTFLGGVWANESWGRYWGWDPKETWALVIVLTYSVVLHLRLVKGWKGKYLFNVTSLFAYASVLMTFFGVNYYLSGLHSYAGGSAPPIPAFVYPTLIIILIISIIAYIRNRRLT